MKLGKQELNSWNQENRNCFHGNRKTETVSSKLGKVGLRKGNWEKSDCIHQGTSKRGNESIKLVKQ